MPREYCLGCTPPHRLCSFKWKPPSENSIDFKLVLRFPPSSSRSPDPDYFAKPVFELHVYCGDERGLPRYEFYDVMHVEDDEWERWVNVTYF